ncbi:MAG: DUF1345 domain-containing protein [Proteobacteria bacterium]|nr:DUF1345 domain-containing protein [Pseudomonadota bacterium]
MVQHRTIGSSGPARLWHRLKRRPVFNLAALLFVLLAVGMSAAGVQARRGLLLAFDIAALFFLLACLRVFATSGPEAMRARARDQDEGYWGFLLGSAGVATVALVALAMELHASDNGMPFEVVLAACSLLLAWFFINTIFALHYAHEYYGDHGDKRSGLDFPGRDKQPDYWDFLYFAFVIGMTFQVSDVQISDRRIRHVVLVHSLITFFFNVIIIALSVNVVAGKA